MDDSETVEFDVVQSKQGTEAVNVTEPVGSLVKCSSFDANRPGFCHGFCNHHRAPQPRSPRGAKEDNNEGESSHDGFTVSQPSQPPLRPKTMVLPALPQCPFGYQPPQTST